MRAAIVLLLLPLCTLAGFDTTRDQRLANGARLQWVPCWFDIPLGEEAHCAHFLPSPANSGVRLPVVILKYSQTDARASPLLYLPAGPGYPAGLDARGMGIWWNQVDRMRWPHDLVLFDVRGTGLARPRLDCPEILDADRAGLSLPLSAAQDLQRLQTAARDCYRRLRAAGIDPSEFSAAVQVRDAGELMALLGGTDWNLWGISYGTRLALHVLREYPQRVRAAILDSVYPPEVNGLLAKPEQFSRTLDSLLALCAGDERCAKDHPRLAQQLPELMTRLAKKPMELSVEKWPAQWRYRLALNDYRLLWMLFLESYRPPYHPRYPRAIAAAHAGQYEPMLALAESFIDTLLDPDFSHGLYYATLCAEDLAGVDRAGYLAQVRRYPAVAAHMSADWDLHVCHDWPIAPLPSRYHAAVVSKVPALFVNGVHDTVTLPQWAVDASARFTRSRRYVFPGSSHAVSWDNDCAMAFVWEFLARPKDWREPACLPKVQARVGEE